MKYHYTKRNKQLGFSLIEVLVSMLILGIGLLGLSALQFTALQHNTAAYNRSLATTLATDIADRMRANKTATIAGDYITPITNGPSGANTCINNPCAPAALAAFDLDEWKCQLGRDFGDAACIALGYQGSLPEGVGQITTDGTNFTITIMWDDERNGVAVNAANCGPDPDLNATCFTLTLAAPSLT